MTRRVSTDPNFAARLEAANERYAADRDADVPEGAEPRPTGGVGGVGGHGVKCLHAHYGDHAAGNDNPIGEDTAERIEPLDCLLPCVAEGAGGVTANPDWFEPK